MTDSFHSSVAEPASGASRASDQEPSPRASGAKVPPVVVVLVTRDAGARLEESLESLAQQDYRELVVLVVDAGSDADPTLRVASVLPDAYVLAVDPDTGFAEAANSAVASVEGAQFVLFCHDDVAFKPDAVRHLVEESFRSDAAVVGPKLVRWDQPRELVSVGLNVDRFGVESTRVEPGEFDQQQHDGVEDVFSLSGAALLVRAEVFDEIGGFDEAISARGEVLDLCWRVQVSGHRVIVAPMARVRWSGEAQMRASSVGDRALLRRHRLRSMLANYRSSTLARVLPIILLHDLVELVASMLSGRRQRAGEVTGAWRWNLANRKSARTRRQDLKPVRALSDLDVRRMQEPGSTRILRFLRNRFGLSNPDEALGGLRTTISEALASRIHLDAILMTAFAGFIFVVGTRHLLGGALPAFGDFLPVGASDGTLRSLWASGERQTGLGSDVAPPTALGLFGLLGWLPLVSADAVAKVLILGALPFGWFATWRLARRLGNRRAQLAAVAVSMAIPLPYNAIALGDWSALTAWAVAPLILGRLIDASEIEPLAIPRPAFATVIGLGAILALTATISPVVVLLTLAMGAALVVGSLLHGTAAGAARVIGTTLAGAGFAIVAHMPWSLDLITSTDGWTSIVGVRPRVEDGIGGGELLTFNTGPHGAGWLLVGLLGASFGALLIGLRWRLAVAVRLATVAVAFWALAIVGNSGVAPFSLPTASTLLVPAAAAIPMLAGLTVASMGRDLRVYRFGWRQFFTFAAPVALLVALVPTLVNSFDGRWKAPQSGYAATFAFLEDESASASDTQSGDSGDSAQDFRVLWVGHPEVLPADGWRLTEELSYLTTINGFIGLNERFPGPETTGDQVLQEAVLASGRGEMTRLGQELALSDVRYVVVVEGNAPAPRTTIDRPAPPWLTDSFDRQLDLFEVQVNQAARIYRNVSGAESDLAASSVGAPSGSLTVTDGPGARRRGFQVTQILTWLAAVVVALPLMIKSRASRRTELARRRSELAEGEESESADGRSDEFNSTGTDEVIDLRQPREIDLRHRSGEPSQAGAAIENDDRPETTTSTGSSPKPVGRS